MADAISCILALPLLEFKIFLNDELGRIKESLKSSLSESMLREDNHLNKSMKKVLGILEGMRDHEIGSKDMTIILNAQGLVEELKDGN